MTPTVARGAPGIEARWTSSAKSGVGTALSARSPLWFTISHGILNEIYYPRLDSACTRDMGLVVTGRGGYFSEEKRDAVHSIEPFEDGVPGYRLTNTASDGAYRIEKRIVTDSKRPVLLQETSFTTLKDLAADYHVYALLAPHLVNAGMGNTAWISHALFSQYTLPFEVAALILTVAVVAAILLTLRRREGVKTQNPGEQVRVRASDRMRIVKMESSQPAVAAQAPDAPAPEKAP